jgi:hypothetical protein
MSRFIKIIEKYSSSIVLEQDVPPPPDTSEEPGLTAAPADVDNIPDMEDKPDVPAGIATMGNLLKKALTMKINDDDKYKISQLPEINEKNADEIINKLLAIMKTYSADIDIDNNPDTSL